MGRRLRAGVIGLGNMGRHHARNYAAMDDVDLVAVVDVDAASRQLASDYEASFFSHHLQMLERSTPDVVSIAVPTPLHHRIASDALNAGCDVLVEKPIAMSESEAQDLIDLANRAALILTVGHLERFNPAVRTLKGMLGRGELGEISSISARRVGGFPRHQPPTDVVLDLAIHDIDIMSFLLQQTPTVIAAHGSRTFHPTETDSAEVLLRFAKASGFVQANWVTPIKIRTLAATGSKGYAELNYITQEVTTFTHVAVPADDDFSDFVRAFGEPPASRVRPAVPQEPLRLELTSFVEAARTRDPSGLMSPGEAQTALRVAREVSALL